MNDKGSYAMNAKTVMQGKILQTHCQDPYKWLQHFLIATLPPLHQ